MRKYAELLVVCLVIVSMPVISAFPQDWASPAGGGWIEFDGERSFAVARHDRSLDIGSGDFTIEAWIYPRDTLNEHDEWVIMAKPGSFELLLAGGGHRINVNQGNKFAIFWRIGHTTNIMSDSMLGGWIFDGWHHIAVSGGKKTQLSLYFDRQKRSFDPTPRPPWASRSDLYIGGIKGRGNSFFEGGMDEIRISAKILEPEGGKLRADRDTIALWHFSEGKWSKVFKDSAGNGHTLITGELLAVDPAGKLATTWGWIRCVQ